ncbi:MAG: metal ABC transporter ATP-binding protein [Thermodesulfobacteriota bacterium]
MENRIDGNAAVVFDQVSVSLGGVQILDSVNAYVPRGGSTAIIGPNGAGKTTLLLTLLGQVAFRGAIRVAGADHGRPARIGYVPQRLDFDRGLPLTVLELMVMGRQRRPLWFGVRKRFQREAKEFLSAVKAEHLAGRRVGALSGGELQRVLLALALQRRPELVILDEPAAGVDIQGEHLLCELLETLRRQADFTQIMVSHDLSLVTAHAGHVICLNRRVMGQGRPEEVIRPEVLEKTFGLHRGLPTLNLFKPMENGRWVFTPPPPCGGHDPEEKTGHA